jgi:hypothetical protein
MGSERGPLSLVSTIEELLERKSSGSGLESPEYGRRDPSHWPRDAFYPQKLALTSPTSGGRSVGIVRSRTQSSEFFIIMIIIIKSRGSTVGIATGYVRAGQPRCRNSSPGRVKIFHFPIESRPALGPTQPPIQWVPRHFIIRPHGVLSNQLSTRTTFTLSLLLLLLLMTHSTFIGPWPLFQFLIPIHNR